MVIVLSPIYPIYHCVEEVNIVKANGFLQWENCVFKEAWKTSVHRPSEALTPGSCVEKQVSDCTISGKGQEEKASILQFIWRDSCFEEVHFKRQFSSVYKRHLLAVWESQRGKDKRRETERHKHPEHYCKSICQYSLVRQPNPANWKHICCQATPVTSAIFIITPLCLPQWHLGLKIAHRLLSVYKMADFFSYVHKRDVTQKVTDYACMLVRGGWG